MVKMKKAIREKQASVKACQVQLSVVARMASPEKKCAARKSILAKLAPKENKGGNPQDAPPELSHA